MNRVAEQTLSLHVELALACAAPAVLSDISHVDGHRRRMAVTRLAEHISARMSCFEIQLDEQLDAGPLPLFPEQA